MNIFNAAIFHEKLLIEVLKAGRRVCVQIHYILAVAGSAHHGHRAKTSRINLKQTEDISHLHALSFPVLKKESKINP